jgi:NAD(P)-dependent dehydrogenase (short-subunit alcohol dehydrogenase family)
MEDAGKTDLKIIEEPRKAAEQAHSDLPDFAALLDYSPPEGQLAGRVIMVTGAADGIGRAVAAAYARLGASTILLDRNRKGLEAASDTFSAEGWTAPGLCPVDLGGASLDDLKQVADRVGESYGRLDGLLNNAGWIGALMPFEHYDPTLWAKVVNTNMAAPFFLTQVCMPLLQKSADPAIVFSLHSVRKAYWGGYAMAKAGLEALVRVLADEHHPGSANPMRVIGIDTGPVSTAERRRHYPGEPADSRPSPDSVVGPYLYAMSAQAGKRGGLIVR